LPCGGYALPSAQAQNRFSRIKKKILMSFTMKKIILLAAATLLSVGAIAQQTGFVHTEKIFRSLPEYEAVLKEIDAAAQAEQAKVDAEFLQIAEMYERYQYQRESLSESARKQVEEDILRLEKEATEKQTAVFGAEGTLIKQRVEKLKPIQDRVFAVVDLVARLHKCDLVLDIANNPAVVYYNPAKDLTEEVIRSLGIEK
jgi:outer membrane protein